MTPERGTRAWTPLLNSAQAARTLEAARLIAGRVTSPQGVRAAVELASEQTAFPQTVYWDEVSLAQGDAGQALLCSQLHACFPDEGWDHTGHAHLERSVTALEERGNAPPSIVSGLSGIAFSAKLLGRGHGYRHLRSVLGGRISADALSNAAALSGRNGMSVAAFDLISGLSGITAYLLPSGEEDRLTHPALPHALRALIELALAEGLVPAWHTPAHLLHDADEARRYPSGILNCGLAHGIPGPLAVMALAAGQGAEIDGLTPAIRKLADWLLSHRHDDDAGLNWPTVVPLAGDGDDVRIGPVGEPSRSAWCYGSPGIARALWLAGRALGDDDLCKTAVRAMEAIYRRSIPERRIDSPTLCHGVAGLLQVTLRFAHDTRLPVFSEAAGDLTEQILACVDPDRPMGIANIEPAGNLVDQPGFLDGATGVALVLLAAATDHEPVWDRVLALS
jgi:hypothetical protein